MTYSNAQDRSVLPMMPDTCPICGSHDIDWAHQATELDPDYFSFSNGLAWTQGYCNTCDSQFEFQYEITRAVILHDGRYWRTKNGE